jgi:hypothetical protein
MDYESKCPVTGKRKYDTEGEALSTASHQISTNHAPEQLHAYICNYCESWHLTKSVGNAEKKRKRR